MLRINKLSMHRLSELAEQLQDPGISNNIYQSGEMIFTEGTYAHGLFYIDNGTILLSTTKQTGTDVALNVIGSNNFIGYLPLVHNKRYASTAHALQDNCRVRFISKDLFQNAMTDNRFLNGFMKILCELILSYENQSLQLKTKSARENLAATLISLNQAFRKSTKDSAPMILLKKKDLASLIGIAPETLSRNLADLEKEGRIELHIKGIKVKDNEQLKLIADGAI